MTGEGSSARSVGRYELLRLVARGGMADIYLARHHGIAEFERHVALKVMNTARAADAEACQMFLDEARVVALLNHQNIAAVLDVGVVDGQHYLAMEYVHGADLRELLAVAARRDLAMPYETAISIVCAAAAGLDHAHRRCGPDGKPLRIVHRDVSLSNIMVGHDGSVKVVDFGIATTAIATVHTSPGVVRGKASYMSPEQCLGDRVDHRTDVFALGVVLYELTTGARCFAGKTDFERMMAVVHGEYVAPSALVPGFPAALERVIRRALAVDAEQRFASAAALIEALEQISASEGWITGPTVIARTMRQLYGDVADTWPALDAGDASELEVPVSDEQLIEEIVALAPLVEDLRTERQLPVIPPVPAARRIARGTEAEASTPPTPAPVLARGSEPDLRRMAGWAPTPSGIDPDDEPTRGRAPLRRAQRTLAA